MSKQGEHLQNYNTQLVKCIEEMREKKETVTKKIVKLEEEKQKITKNIASLTQQLGDVEGKLTRNIKARDKYEQTIQETETAYMKILESSQTLLHVLKREQSKISKKH
jgi:Sjoegren syndrome nuclear autoantigen 1